MSRIALGTTIVLTTLVGIGVLWELRAAVAIFVVSLAVAASLRPGAESLSHAGLRRAMGLGGIYVALLVVLVAVLLAGVGLGAVELRRLGPDFVRVYERIAQVWPHDHWLAQAVAWWLPSPAQITAAVTPERAAGILQHALGTAFNVAEALVQALAVLVLSIYWSTERVGYERLWLSLFEVGTRTQLRDVWHEIEGEVGDYVRNEVIQILLAGAMLNAGYQLMGLRYPVLQATIGALAWSIPWVGVVIAVTAVGLLSVPTLVLDWGSVAVLVTVGAVGYTLLVLLLLEVFVEPRFFDRRRYSSLLMVLAVVAMANTMGILGLLLGPPLAVAVQVLGRHLTHIRMVHNVSDSIAPEVGLSERMAGVRAMLSETPNPPPELASLADRLESLVHQAEPMLQPPNRRAEAPSKPDGLPGIVVEGVSCSPGSESVPGRSS
jgi:putative permease